MARGDTTCDDVLVIDQPAEFLVAARAYHDQEVYEKELGTPPVRSMPS